MSEYTISQVCPTDRTVLAQIDALLQQEGIRRDGRRSKLLAHRARSSSKMSRISSS